jgi:hypothetical protein
MAKAATGGRRSDRGDDGGTHRLIVAPWLSLGDMKRWKFFVKLGKYRLSERKGRRRYVCLSKLRAIEFGY